MPGLRERKRRKTVTAIHDAAMRLFAERDYADVTVTEIADAAEVSRATVFAYYGTKEDIVVGDAPAAVEALRVALAERPPEATVSAVVRGWIATLTGWVEHDMILQRRLAAEVPAVAAARSRLKSAVEETIADALAREAPDSGPLASSLAAGALTSALAVVEAEAARRFEAGEARLDGAALDTLFDQAIAFVDGGLERLRSEGR